ncbi:MAG: antibiotic biosynthesis monooxygenase [Rhodospirillaceae bacterium]|nr:antibiotic biosynthesis monooxygenase [Rhodospirillaceae bacterium]
MIVRTWRGRTTSAWADAYPRHFHGNVMPELEAIPGFLGADLLKEEKDGQVEYFVLTRWASLDAIKAFAGEDYEQAVVEPEAVAALDEFDRTVRHYETVEA